MIIKILRQRKYRKVIRVIASFILEEFATLISDAIDHFDKEGKIKSAEHKEALKFESIALLFWLFQKTAMFPEVMHKLILDDMHNEYYSRLRKLGFDSNALQLVCDDFNNRYKTYGNSFNESDDLSKIGVKFVSYVSKRAKIEVNVKDLLIPLYLTQKAAPKFKEFRNVMKNQE